MDKKKDFKELLRFIKFLFFSISAGIIQFGAMALFYEVFKWEWWLSYIISLFLSVAWNFTINRKFTFKSANNIKLAMLLVLAFYVVFAPASLFLGDWIEGLGVDGLIVEAGIMILNFVLEFLYTRYVVYRNSCDTAKKKGE
ncbi:MAG: GtrA family protein [Clostridiales bacterium]|nr:GtrA family protein [Clostridiales bacterium]